MMLPSPAQYMGLCHTCRLRHPCRTVQAFDDFCQRHPSPAHHTSCLNRDWLWETQRSPLAVWDPRKMVQSAVGAWEAWRLRRQMRDVWAYAGNADHKQAFGASTAMTGTFASLTSSATVGRECTAVDNASNLYLDALVQVKVDIGAGTIANDQALYEYIYGSEDGSTYTDNATGTDAAITFRVPSAIPIAAAIPIPTQSIVYEGQPFSVAKNFDGIMPRKWGLAIRNYSGIAMSATEGNHTKTYSGVYATVI